MITLADRRKQPGMAIVTVRSGIKWRYESAGVPNRVYRVQNGNTWPNYRPPLVLDTIGMPAQMLVDLLADPPKVQDEQPETATQAAIKNPQTNKLQEKSQFAPLIALADPHDWRALRLLKLCPMVQLVCPDDPLAFRYWLPNFDSIVLTRSGDPLAGWLVDPAPDLKLDPLLLAALAVLPLSPSTRVAAERCGVSDSTMARMLRLTKTMLKIPPGEISRFRPEEVAAIILDRLGSDSPTIECRAMRYQAVYKG